MALVLFDCDGVLVNTEALIVRIGREALSAFGLVYTEQAFEDRFLGTSNDEFRRLANEDCMDRVGVTIPEQIFTNMMARYMQEEAAHIQAIAGVLDFIESLERSKVPFALASNSNRANIERKLKSVGLYDLFAGRIFSREDVQHGKPAPDIYLHAMKAMGETDPQKCIVVEDSSVGVTAGHAAGMNVLGYTGGSRNPAAYALKLTKAGAVFIGNSMTAIAFEVFELVDKIDQGPNWRNASMRAKRGLGGPAPV